MKYLNALILIFNLAFTLPAWSEETNPSNKIELEVLPACPKDEDPTLTVKACFGTHTYDPGGSYTGDFKFGTRHGHGTYVYDDGTIYEGGWSYGKSN